MEENSLFSPQEIVVERERGNKTGDALFSLLGWFGETAVVLSCTGGVHWH